MTYGVRISGVGAAIPGYDNVPGRIVGNDTLAEELLGRGKQKAKHHNLQGNSLELFLKDFITSHEWICERTGIEKRSFVESGMATSDLAVIAGAKTLRNAGIDPSEVERIDLATVTPDHPHSPPTVAIIAEKLRLGKNGVGLPHLFGNDTTLACSSSFAALTNAFQAIASGVVKNSLVIGADVMSSAVNQNSRDFFVVLGDAAGALFLERCAPYASAFTPLGFYGGMDGSFAHRIITKVGGSRNPIASEAPRHTNGEHKLSMEGQKVFKEVVLLVPKVVEEALRRTIRDEEQAVWSDRVYKELLGRIDVLLFHQANLRIIDLVGRELKGKGFNGTIYNNIMSYGNTTSAAVFLLLKETHEQSILKYGDTFMAVVFGGGYTWGTVIGKWTLK